MYRRMEERARQDTLEKSLLQQIVLHKRRVTLKKVLFNYMGLILSREQPDLLLEDIEYAGLSHELDSMSKDLGLSREELPLQASRIDIEVNGVAIALDDEFRFNSSRLQTLSSPIYKLPLIYNLDRYKSYCLQQPSAPRLLLDGRKMKRSLKLRQTVGRSVVAKLGAINDFMQDLLPLVHYVPVLRISVFDQLETHEGVLSMDTLLSEDCRKHYEILADYLIKQLNDLESSFHLEY
jgi:hypothetical protein